MAPKRALKLAIGAAGLKQKDVARRARIALWRLSRIVHRDVEARPDERARLARVLKTPVDELFEVTQ